MTSDDFPSDGSPLDFFDREDALAIKWYHGANSLAQMNEALEGDYMMYVLVPWKHGFFQHLKIEIFDVKK